MDALTLDDFPAFFGAVHGGAAPYPWQRRLLAEVWARGGWPAQLDLPTGSGKTSAIDVAVFLLALSADPASGRRLPRRIVSVVDRRTIVDQSHAHASRIAAALEGGAEPVLRVVAARLRALSGGDASPLRATVLRGGMVRDDGWARTPTQAMVISSTVDQVGSRLLFRGFGVSDSMKPVHAGLLGADVLYLLDEVHLAVPFEETLSAVAGRYAAWAEEPIAPPIEVVRLSATPRPGGGAPFRLDDADWADPRLAQRLNASKPTALATCDQKALVPTLVERALALGSGTIGVLCNRVDTARRVAQALEGKGHAVHLLTGRMRPIDREAAERAVAPFVAPARPEGLPERPTFLVATQCIEAGADFDLDGMVTECASFDALMQRLGRLNRTGRRAGARAVIVGVKEQVAGKTPDPVYGGALAATWACLSEHAEGLDLGPAAAPVPSPAEREALVPPARHAPVLLPAYLDRWAQTAPVPDPDPDVSLWLHGPQRASDDVSVVWRADLSEALLATEGEAARAAIVGRVAVSPPGSPEALSVPRRALLAWLAGAEDMPVVSDVEGDEVVDERPPRAGRPVLRWRGADDDRTTVLSAETLRHLRPGDTVVLPSSYGGIGRGTWDPEATEPVVDLGDRVQLRLRGRPTLRLHVDVLASAGIEVGSCPTPRGEEDRSAREILAELWGWVGVVASSLEETKALLDALRAQGRSGLRLLRSPAAGDAPEAWTLTTKRRVRQGSEATTEPADSSFLGEEVTLARHLGDVGQRAADFAAACGLSSTLVDALRRAGAVHDVGKLDPRFQLLLHGGDAVRAAGATEPLAKSAVVMADASARRRARDASGYPAGARHELLSLAWLQATGAEDDLVAHLVASHHGHARPFVPVAVDDRPVRVVWEGVAADSDHRLYRLDAGVADRFWRLVRRYGWHGLAWLEAVLRLADHRASEDAAGGGR